MMLNLSEAKTTILRALSEKLPFLTTGKPAQKAHIGCGQGRKFTAEKQEKLDALCEALLRKKELLASGKIQLIGLAKVQKRLGKR